MLSPLSFMQFVMFIIVGVVALIMFLSQTSHYHLLLISIASFLLSYTIYKDDNK